MFRILLVLFILVPIVEIAVFIQVGEVLGLGITLFTVVITAVLGVNLLKQQGFKAWRDIQQSMAQGKVPAVEMAAGAQLLFAGGLLLTPGFVTDIIGFSLMVPQLRLYLAKHMIKRGIMSAVSANTDNNSSNFNYTGQADFQSGSPLDNTKDKSQGRTIEGDFEEK